MTDLDFCHWVRLHAEATTGSGAVHQRLIEATDRLAIAAGEIEGLRNVIYAYATLEAAHRIGRVPPEKALECICKFHQRERKAAEATGRDE